MSFLPPNQILIYSDGACSGNPGPGGWGSIVLTPGHQVTELGGGEGSTTNNRMEMMGALRALEFVAGLDHGVLLYTDSTYLIRGITQWVGGWQRRGWQSANGAEVANQDLWQRLVEVTKRRGPKYKVDWRYVRGHTDVPGNERCDQIAVAFSQGSRPSLYNGPLPGYDLDLLTLPKPEKLPETKFNGATKKAAYSYLSYVNGKLTRHANWSSCEAATKGRPGARFKKAASAEDEIAIVREWGLDPSRLKAGR
ncbi:MAG: ribonuclease HI [Bdellovibrionales bacterium]